MMLRVTLQSLLVALLIVLVAAVVLAVLPQRTQRLTVQADTIGPFIADGETSQLRNFFGFRDVEQAGTTPFRWTSGEGSFVVRRGEALGAPLLLDVHLCGCRTNAEDAPHLALRVNGAVLAETRATAHWNEWRRYRLLLPRQHTSNNDLLLELLSDYVPNAESGVPLGVAFHRATLSPLGDQRAYTAAVAVGLGVLAGAVGYVTLALGGAMWRALLHAVLALALMAVQGYVGGADLPAWALAAALALALGLAIMFQSARHETSGTAYYLLPVILFIPIVLTQLLGVWMLDDAYISFRYARNALLGNGFVFNAGERVEGYTNFLWTALFVPLLRWNADLALASQVLTLLIALLIAALTWVGARRVASAPAALAALALLVTSAPFLLYTARGSGMETALFTLLVLVGLLVSDLTTDHQPGLRAQQVVGRRSAHNFPSSVLNPQSSVLLSGVLLGLAAMTRPEGVLVAGIVGLYLLWRAYHDRRPTTNDRRPTTKASCIPADSHPASRIPRPASRILFPALTFALGFVVIFGPYYVWRYSYYGYPLPNTFYAKVGGNGAQAVRGLEYATDFALAQAPLVALAVFGYVLTIAKTRRFVSLASVVRGPWSIVIPVYTLYIIAVGGDHFPFYRFFVPLLPLLAIQAAAGIDSLRLTRWRAATWVPSIIALAGIGYYAPQLYESRTLNADGRVWGENSVVEKNREIGLWMRANTPPDTLIATGIAGALPYYSERPVLDALGLNDLHIAHLDVPTMGTGTAGAEKTDVPYILSRRPSYIPYNSAEPFQSDPTFATSYRRMIVRGPEGRAVRLYRRADLPAPRGSREAAP